MCEPLGLIFWLSWIYTILKWRVSYQCKKNNKVCIIIFLLPCLLFSFHVLYCIVYIKPRSQGRHNCRHWWMHKHHNGSSHGLQSFLPWFLAFCQFVTSPLKILNFLPKPETFQTLRMWHHNQTMVKHLWKPNKIQKDVPSCISTWEVPYSVKVLHVLPCNNFRRYNGS